MSAFKFHTPGGFKHALCGIDRLRVLRFLSILMKDEILRLPDGVEHYRDLSRLREAVEAGLRWKLTPWEVLWAVPI